jgi:hypothetical protein
MKTYKRHLTYLKISNLLCLIAIFTTILYCWYTFRLLGDFVHVPKGLANTDLIVVNKSVVWDDIRLMGTIYLLLSLVTVFMELTPFRQSSGFHKAQFVSLINVCISVVFAYTIISSVRVAAQY